MKAATKFIDNGDYLISKETFNNGDFDYRILIEKISLKEATGEKGYIISSNAVKTPAFIDPDKLTSIAYCAGIDTSEVKEDDIFHYGLYAKFEDHFCLLKKEVKTKIGQLIDNTTIYNSMFGFYLDKQINRIGNTGWDSINGNTGLFK